MEASQLAHLVQTLLELVDKGLVTGVGDPVPGQMCGAAAISYALGEPHGDEPSCVSRAVRQFITRMNDAKWSGDRARAKGMRNLLVASLGSTAIDSRRFLKIVSEQTIRRVVPIALRAAADRLPERRELLRAAALRCEREGTFEAANAADDAAADDAYAYAAYAAYAAKAAADDAAAYAESAACAACAAAAAAAAAAAHDLTRDAVLSVAVDLAVEALRECGSPGVAFLPEEARP